MSCTANSKRNCTKYKKNALRYVEEYLLNDEIDDPAVILMDLTKAFDKVNRKLLWTALYRQGLPIEFIRKIRLAHLNTKLTKKIGKHMYTDPIENNVGVFQGGSISALLFIIYAEDMMGDFRRLNELHCLPYYANTLKPHTLQFNEAKTNMVRYWELYHKEEENDNTNKRKKPNAKQQYQWEGHHENYEDDINQNTIDDVEYADDTKLLIPNYTSEQIQRKLQNYDAVAYLRNLVIKWEDVTILRNTNKPPIKLIGKFEAVKTVGHKKILGKVINYKGNASHAVKARITQANKAWGMVAGTLCGKYRLDKKLRLNLSNATIRCIMTYGLQITNLNDKEKKQLNAFTNKCMRKMIDPMKINDNSKKNTKHSEADD